MEADTRLVSAQRGKAAGKDKVVSEPIPIQTPEPRLFSDAALAVLDRMSFDPAARGKLEVMSGGLMWPDEFPRPGARQWEPLQPGCLYRFLLAYRALITLNPEHAQAFDLWEQVVRDAPNWPGLRAERRGEAARNRLRAALRRFDKCLAESESDPEMGNPNA
jgi:hypothetical protein